MIIVGIDSAARSGWAVVARDSSGERLIAYGAANVETAADVERVIGDLAAHSPDVWAIEEPFVSFKNPETGLALARLLGRWAQALETRGHTIVTIPASMWQTAVLPGVTRQTRSAERKAAAVSFVRQRFGVMASEDEADAVALAVYVSRTATRRAA